jgi:hypothetical protein
MSIFKNMAAYRLVHSKQPMYGSVDLNSVCNLHLPIATGGSTARKSRT